MLHNSRVPTLLVARNNTSAQNPSPDQLQPLIALFNRGELRTVLERTINLLRAYPESASLHNFRGIVCAGLGQVEDAVASYSRALRLQPDFVDACSNLASTQIQAGDLHGAITSFRKLTELLPNSADAHYNLAVTQQAAGDFESAIPGFRRTLELNPAIAEAHNNLGLTLFKTGEPEAALESYQAAIACKPDFAEAYNNLGIVLYESGALNGALQHFTSAIQIKPDLADAHNHCGNVHTDRGDLSAARRSFASALEVDPDHAEACWNLAGTAADSGQCLHWLERCLHIEPEHHNATLLRAAMRAAQNESDDLTALRESGHRDHPFMRSFDWVFGQPKLPVICCNRWAFFDAVIENCDRSRPFYEFGVWRGQSFRYLMRSFSAGYGFDTFAGLPEDWHEHARGSYSSAGHIPDIERGEFVAGEFEHTLPEFFARDRPLAALINFDADLYTSTLCALEHANRIIDDKTILVFDEMIMNEHWEQDEYRALVEFCQHQGCSYEVLTVCFFSKQVAVKLTRS